MIVLKSISQDVDLTGVAEGKYSNFLVFDRDGEEFRAPVPQETIQSLLKWFNQHTNATANGPREPTMASGDAEVVDDSASEDKEEMQEDEHIEVSDDPPQSEEDVASL